MLRIPAVLGAVLFVHRREGLFTAAQTLELTLLVLFILALLTIESQPAGCDATECFARATRTAQGAK